MASKPRSRAISIRPNLTIYEAMDPGLYRKLESLPENVRSQFILDVLRRAARGECTPMSCDDEAALPALPVTSTSVHEDSAERKPPAHDTPQSNQATVASAPSAPRGLEALGFGSIDDLGDAFVYDDKSKKGT